jgi:peroxiredoxin
LLTFATVVLLLSASPAGALEVGSVAPGFRLTPIEGSPFDFTEAARTHVAVVVVFLSVVCPYSNLHEKYLRELDEHYESKGVLLVGVNSNRTETAEEVAAHARKGGPTFPMVKDQGNQVADLLGARVTPEAFLFDRDARLRYRGRIRSKIGAPDLQNALDAVLAGRPVKTPVAKAFGCTIVRE